MYDNEFNKILLSVLNKKEKVKTWKCLWIFYKFRSSYSVQYMTATTYIIISAKCHSCSLLMTQFS